jgi:hypothetical protein
LDTQLSYQRKSGEGNHVEFWSDYALQQTLEDEKGFKEEKPVAKPL